MGLSGWALARWEDMITSISSPSPSASHIYSEHRGAGAAVRRVS
ncbi:hypothetical protein MMCCUG48898_2585 [Mycobacteroides abscessus subsp. massiliense CCUG 48898 = JCM 15300]|nr:hypothetical protein MMCCUG48898_2585 [Mycobacteroides abscessus subsp. massiliense CCUG 48898 = JCM 15300]